MLTYRSKRPRANSQRSTFATSDDFNRPPNNAPLARAIRANKRQVPQETRPRCPRVPFSVRPAGDLGDADLVDQRRGGARRGGVGRDLPGDAGASSTGRLGGGDRGARRRAVADFLSVPRADARLPWPRFFWYPACHTRRCSRQCPASRRSDRRTSKSSCRRPAAT